MFIAFARSLPGEIPGIGGSPLRTDDVIDFDLCFAYDFTDPWGNRFELNCFDHDRVRRELIDTDRVTAIRYWPAHAYHRFDHDR